MGITWQTTALGDRLRADAQEDIQEAAKSDARRRAEANLLAQDRRSGYGRRHQDSGR